MRSRREPGPVRVLWTGTVFQGLLEYRKALLLLAESKWGRRDRRYHLYRKELGDQLHLKLEALFEQLVREEQVRLCPCIQQRTGWRDRLRFSPECACGGSGFVPINAERKEVKL